MQPIVVFLLFAFLQYACLGLPVALEVESNSSLRLPALRNASALVTPIMSDEQVTLVSSDGNRFEVQREVAEMADTVKNLLAEMADDEATVPLMNVRGEILAKVIEYCKFHVEAKAPNADTNKPARSEDDIQSWDKDFVKVDKSILFELILAANYLNIKDLLDLTCQAVADLIKGKTPEEIRKEFNIENDFSPAEEEEVRRENQWAFD